MMLKLVNLSSTDQDLQALHQGVIISPGYRVQAPSGNLDCHGVFSEVLKLNLIPDNPH